MGVVMRRIFALCLCIATVFCFSSCNSDDKESLDILCELLVFSKGKISEPEGVYTTDAEEGDPAYFSEEMKKSLYGEKRASECFEIIEDCAVFVSGRGAEELAVFKCYSRSDTDAVAAMCLERSESLRVALKQIKNQDTSKTTQIEIHGRYVLFSFMGRSEAIAEYFRELT